MNAFEQLVADCLRRQGFWTTIGVKVALSREEKQLIERPSSPRWELDVLAYRPTDNSLLVIECKSYLDSGGVDPRDFEPGARYSTRYKLFTDERLWPVISTALIRQLVESKLVLPNPSIRLGLAYGKAVRLHELRALFARQGWQLLERRNIISALVSMADDGWENSTTSIVAKLLRPYLKDENGRALANPYLSLADDSGEAHYDALQGREII